MVENKMLIKLVQKISDSWEKINLWSTGPLGYVIGNMRLFYLVVKISNSSHGVSGSHCQECNHELAK